MHTHVVQTLVTRRLELYRANGCKSKRIAALQFALVAERVAVHLSVLTALQVSVPGDRESTVSSDWLGARCVIRPTNLRQLHKYLIENLHSSLSHS